MLSRRHLFYLLASMLVLSLLLVACERPIPGGDGEATATPDVDAGGGVQPPVEEAPGEEAPVEEAPVEEAPVEEAPGEEAPVEETPGEEAPVEETPGEEAPVEEAPGEETPVEETPGEASAGDATGGQTVTTIPETHTVAAGENLYRIGLRYGLSWQEIARFNGINPHRIYVGQVLRLPGGDTGGGVPPTDTTYVVQRGDNLYRIGLRFGVSWVQIAEANGLGNPNQIYVGQTLKIPVSTPGPNPEFTHLVRPGQTLFRISLQYGVPWMTIAEANNIASPYTIYVGQTLVIPGSS